MGSWEEEGEQAVPRARGGGDGACLYSRAGRRGRCAISKNNSVHNACRINAFPPPAFCRSIPVPHSDSASINNALFPPFLPLVFPSRFIVPGLPLLETPASTPSCPFAVSGSRGGPHPCSFVLFPKAAHSPRNLYTASRDRRCRLPFVAYDALMVVSLLGSRGRPTAKHVRAPYTCNTVRSSSSFAQSFSRFPQPPFSGGLPSRQSRIAESMESHLPLPLQAMSSPFPKTWRIRLAAPIAPTTGALPPSPLPSPPPHTSCSRNSTTVG